MNPHFRFAAALLGLALLASACRRAPQAPAAAPGAAEKPSLMFQGFSARASHDGDLVWEAQAVRAQVFHHGDQALAEDVTLTYFTRGRRVSTGRADRATMDLKAYDVEAEGSVELRGDNGVILRTPRLNWDNKRQRASSQSKVWVRRGGTVLTGRGFTADREMKDVRILADVQAEAVSVQQLRKESHTWTKP